MIDAAHLAGRSLKDDVAERDLAVARHRGDAVAAHAQNCGSVKLFHYFFVRSESEADTVKKCTARFKHRRLRNFKEKGKVSQPSLAT